jgi:hypothetical protein
MTLTGTWTTTPAGTLALAWTPGHAPVRHRRTPPNTSRGIHYD